MAVRISTALMLHCNTVRHPESVTADILIVFDGNQLFVERQLLQTNIKPSDTWSR